MNKPNTKTRRFTVELTDRNDRVWTTGIHIRPEHLETFDATYRRDRLLVRLGEAQTELAEAIVAERLAIERAVRKLFARDAFWFGDWPTVTERGPNSVSGQVMQTWKHGGSTSMTNRVRLEIWER